MNFVMGKAFPTKKIMDMVMGSLYKKLTHQHISSFDDFHVAVLDIFSNFNSSLPGEHYDLPTKEIIEECFIRWQEAEDEEEQKSVFMDFMKNNIKPSKLDDKTMFTGVITPPVAMVAKKTGESIPHLKLIKLVPDVLFVPSFTVLVLVFAKLSRRIFQK